MRARLLLPVLALLPLAACVEPVPPPAPLPEPDRDACGASAYQGLVGQSRAVLAAMTFPAGTRVIEAGDPVTADFRPDRLNVELSAGGRIDKVSCY